MEKNVRKIGKKYKKFSGGLLIGVACFLGTFWLYLQSYYANEYPRTPNISIGRVVPLNVHGTVVYLTETEQSTLTWVFLGAMVCGVCGGALWKQAS